MVVAIRSSTKRNNKSEVQQNVTTKFSHVHEQNEFTFGSYLVAAEPLQPEPNPTLPVPLGGRDH